MGDSGTAVRHTLLFCAVIGCSRGELIARPLTDLRRTWPGDRVLVGESGSSASFETDTSAIVVCDLDMADESGPIWRLFSGTCLESASADCSSRSSSSSGTVAPAGYFLDDLVDSCDEVRIESSESRVPERGKMVERRGIIPTKESLEIREFEFVTPLRMRASSVPDVSSRNLKSLAAPNRKGEASCMFPGSLDARRGDSLRGGCSHNVERSS